MLEAAFSVNFLFSAPAIVSLKLSNEPLCEKTCLRAVQPKMMARGLKFRMLVVEGLYYPYSENKGTDQLRGCREADLRLCFRNSKNPVFSRRGSNVFPSYRLVLTLL